MNKEDPKHAVEKMAEKLANMHRGSDDFEEALKGYKSLALMGILHGIAYERSSSEFELKLTEVARDTWMEEAKKLDKEVKQLKIEIDSPYCPICKSCGESGCCAAERCQYPGIKPEEITELKFQLEESFKAQALANKHLADRTKDVNEWMEITMRERDEKQELRAELTQLKASNSRMRETLVDVEMIFTSQGFVVPKLVTEALKETE